MMVNADYLATQYCMSRKTVYDIISRMRGMSRYEGCICKPSRKLLRVEAEAYDDYMRYADSLRRGALVPPYRRVK